MIFASVLDSLGDVSSLVLGAAAFALLFLFLRARARMSAAELAGLIVAVAVFAYLIVALLRPERF